jgi:transposase
MARRFRPTWTQADYQKVKRDYHRHKLMTKVVDSVLASGLSYADIAKKTGVGHNTVRKWVAGDTKNGKLDTVMAVLNALGLDMKLVSKHEQSEVATSRSRSQEGVQRMEKHARPLLQRK